MITSTVSRSFSTNPPASAQVIMYRTLPSSSAPIPKNVSHMKTAPTTRMIAQMGVAVNVSSIIG